MQQPIPTQMYNLLCITYYTNNRKAVYQYPISFCKGIDRIYSQKAIKHVLEAISKQICRGIKLFLNYERIINQT